MTNSINKKIVLNYVIEHNSNIEKYTIDNHPESEIIKFIDKSINICQDYSNAPPIYVTNELYVFALRLAVKQGKISHEDAEIKYIYKDRFESLSINEDGKLINGDPFTLFDTLMSDLL